MSFVQLSRETIISKKMMCCETISQTGERGSGVHKPFLPMLKMYLLDLDIDLPIIFMTFFVTLQKEWRGRVKFWSIGAKLRENLKVSVNDLLPE